MKTEFKVVHQVPELEELQKFVGGYVEALTLSNGDVLYVCEDGKLLNLPVNKMATAFWVASWGSEEEILGNTLYHLRRRHEV